MKEYLAQLVASSASAGQARNVAREYLQARVLGSLQRSGAMIPLAFQGGTALRLLYAAPRYSEDLDFSLEGDRSRYDFPAFVEAIQSELTAEGYRLDLRRVRANSQRSVHSAFISFAGLPYELGISPQQDETLAVKIEVDTNPPAGAVLKTTVVRRHLTVLHVQHHDRASFLAGKLHALLQRPYEKGRDVFDLFWCLSDPTWPTPNLTLLTNALRQTGWRGDYPAEDTWRALVRRRLQTLDWQRVVADVEPLLEAGVGLELLTLENVMAVLG